MRDQTIQVNENDIKVAYMGSAAKYQPATTEALKSTSDVQIVFVTPEWLFTEQLDNVSKLKVLEEADQLSLIALDEAHLMYEWNSFRPLYIRCQDLPSLFPDTPVMALSATVTPQIMSKLQSFLRNPVIEKGSVYRSNLFLEAIQCTFKQGKDSQGIIIVPDRFYNFKSYLIQYSYVIINCYTCIKIFTMTIACTTNHTSCCVKLDLSIGTILTVSYDFMKQAFRVKCIL